MEKSFDVVVIGSGPGGYPAAIKLAQHGKSVALVEASEVGGTCLNRGCIPTKTLLANAEVLHLIQAAASYGISVDTVRFDYSAMVKRKNQVVSGLRKSLEKLITSHGVTLIKGYASFMAPGEIKVKGEDNVILRYRDAIIAAGSEPKKVASFPFDDVSIYSSTSALEMDKLPKSMIIVGGGVIGCEFASLYADLGVQVTIVEALDRILPLECPTISAFMTAHFSKRGISICTASFVEKTEKQKSGICITLKNGKTLEAEKALVAIGRDLNSQGLGLEKVGVVVDRGAIVVDDSMQTSVPNIYAIGDVTAKGMYAHTATHQGLVAAENITGKKSVMNYNAVPGVVFTRPEIATVGMSLESAKKQGFQAKSVTYPLQALGKAQAALQTEGFAQLVVEETTGQILGAQIIGHEAGILLSPIVYAMTQELTVESITETIHAHPTLGEVWMESAFLAQELPLHFPPVKK